MPVIFGNHPAVCELDTAVFGKSFDLLQIAVVEPLAVAGKAVLGNPNHFPGS
jgi:hypothetical protein